jgi:hypothetical protein
MFMTEDDREEGRADECSSNPLSTSSQSGHGDLKKLGGEKKAGGQSGYPFLVTFPDSEIFLFQAILWSLTAQAERRAAVGRVPPASGSATPPLASMPAALGDLKARELVGVSFSCSPDGRRPTQLAYSGIAPAAHLMPPKRWLRKSGSL